MSVEEMARNMLKEMKSYREELVADRARARIDKEQILNEIIAVSTKVEKLTELQAKVEDLATENIQMRIEMEQLKLQLDLQDQFQKSKNLVIYGVPGVGGESREATEASIRQLLTKIGICKLPILAHRLTQKPNSPILLQFHIKQDAQLVFTQIRQVQNMSLEALAMGENGKVEVRHHLGAGLSELLRSANIVRREAGLAFARPLTSSQSVEIVWTKEQNSKRITVKNLRELVELKDRLQVEGSLPKNSPANEISRTRPYRKRRAEKENFQESAPKKTATTRQQK